MQQNTNGSGLSGEGRTFWRANHNSPPLNPGSNAARLPVVQRGLEIEQGSKLTHHVTSLGQSVCYSCITDTTRYVFGPQTCTGEPANNVSSAEADETASRTGGAAHPSRVCTRGNLKFPGRETT